MLYPKRGSGCCRCCGNSNHNQSFGCKKSIICKIANHYSIKKIYKCNSVLFYKVPQKRIICNDYTPRGVVVVVVVMVSATKFLVVELRKYFCRFTIYSANIIFFSKIHCFINYFIYLPR